ncbi:MAG TPA: hypothetical protein VFH06_04115 [Candidatus Saccharimonadales bacterium]|nr:hypothetical protein [Candidatus Saccharimonadales bacterium]
MLDHIEAHALTLYTKDNDRDWGKSITLRTVPINDDVSSYREKFLIFKPGSSITLEKHLEYDEVWIANRPFDYIGLPAFFMRNCSFSQ